MLCSKHRLRRFGHFLLVQIVLCAMILPAACRGGAILSANDPDPADVCRQFLIRNGWLPSAEPWSVSDVLIPDVFDKVYAGYNALQRAQGFDLSLFCGKTVKKYVYSLASYPPAPEADVQATVFYYNGAVIGGDISCAALDGFMHGLLPWERR